MHNRIFSKSVILNTSAGRQEFVGWWPAALVAARQTARLWWSIYVSAASRTCRFKSERRWRRSVISWCSEAWPAHHARCQNAGIMCKSTSKQHASAYQSWHSLHPEQFWAEAKVCQCLKLSQLVVCGGPAFQPGKHNENRPLWPGPPPLHSPEVCIVFRLVPNFRCCLWLAPSSNNATLYTCSWLRCDHR